MTRTKYIDSIIRETHQRAIDNMQLLLQIPQLSEIDVDDMRWAKRFLDRMSQEDLRVDHGDICGDNYSRAMLEAAQLGARHD